MTQCGVHGSMEYVKQLEAERDALRARIEVLEKVAEAVEKYKRCAHHIHTEQSSSTNRTTVECATFIWDELCAALDAAKAGKG